MVRLFFISIILVFALTGCYKAKSGGGNLDFSDIPDKVAIVAPDNLAVDETDTPLAFVPCSTNQTCDILIQLKNIRDYPASTLGLSADAQAISAPFSFKSGSFPGKEGGCTSTLGPQETCEILLSYSPTATGPHHDTLTLSYINGVMIVPLEIKLSGITEPVLGGLSNKTFPADFVSPESLVSFDALNTQTGTDSGMTYACFFDRLVDDSVADSADCSTLPGTVVTTDLATTGQLSWTPSTGTYGAYEIKFSGTRFGHTGTRIIAVDVRPPFSTTNLLAYWDAEFANSIGQGLNTATGGYARSTTFKDLMNASSTNDGLLSASFGYTAASGWAGTGVSTDPYRLVLNGVDNYVDFGYGTNASTSTTVSAWVKPVSSSTKGSVILSNGDTSGRGFTLRQSVANEGKLQINLGTRSYADEVMADNPSAYWRLGETAGASAVDSSGNGVSGTYAGGYALAQPGALPGVANHSAGFNGATAQVAVPHHASIKPTDSATFELWINPTVISNSDWLVTSMGTPAAQFYIRYWTPNVDFCYVRTAQSYCASVTPASIGITTGTWNHVVFSINTDLQSASIYVNGIFRTSVEPIAQVKPAYESLPVYIGGSSWDGFFSGQIDDVAIYLTALDAARVAAHYAARNNLTCESVSILNDNTWQLLTGLFDSATQGIKLFINGTEECSMTYAGAAFAGSANPLRIGADSTGAQPWSGSIGEVRNYAAPLDSPTIASDCNATQARFDGAICAP